MTTTIAVISAIFQFCVRADFTILSCKEISAEMGDTMRKIICFITTILFSFTLLLSSVTVNASNDASSKATIRNILTVAGITSETTLYDRAIRIADYLSMLELQRYNASKEYVQSVDKNMTSISYDLACQFAVLCSYADISCDICSVPDSICGTMYWNVITVDDIPYYTNVYYLSYTSDLCSMYTESETRCDFNNMKLVQTVKSNPVIKLPVSKVVISEDQAVDIIINNKYLEYYRGTAPLVFMTESSRIYGNDAWYVWVGENMGDHVVTYANFYVTKDNKNIFQYDSVWDSYSQLK